MWAGYPSTAPAEALYRRRLRDGSKSRGAGLAQMEKSDLKQWLMATPAMEQCH